MTYIYIGRYKKSPSSKFFKFKSSDEAFAKCISQQDDDHSNLLKECIVYSSTSLQEMIRKYENDLFVLSEAEFKTYPTRLLTKRIAKLLCEAFNRSKCLVSMSLSNDIAVDESNLVVYDRQANRFYEWKEDEDGKDFPCMMKSIATYVNEDVAGNISYQFGMKDNGNISNQISKSTIKELVEAGNSLGYDYVAYSTFISKGFIFFNIVFEAKFQDVNIEIEDFLYHVAPLSAKDKILSKSLTPKSKTIKNNRQMKHSDRVYVFNGYDIDNIKKFVKDSQKKSISYDGQAIFDSHKFVIFKINRRKIPSLKLYRDNMFQSDDINKPVALYTYSNIPPYAIEVYEQFSI